MAIDEQHRLGREQGAVVPRGDHVPALRQEGAVATRTVAPTTALGVLALGAVALGTLALGRAAALTLGRAAIGPLGPGRRRLHGTQEYELHVSQLVIGQLWIGRARDGD